MTSRDAQYSQWLLGRHNVLREYPSDGLWTAGILGPTTRDMLAATQEKYFFNDHGKIHLPPDRSKIRVWSVVDEDYQRVNEVGNEKGRLTPPCGGTGFSNETGTPWIRCTDCGARFTKSEMKDNE